MPNWKAIGAALQGFGAGVEGNGAQFLQQQEYMRQRRDYEFEQKKQQNQETGDKTQRKVAQEIRIASQNMDSGNVNRTVTVLNDLMRNVGFGPVVQQAAQIKQLLVSNEPQNIAQAQSMLTDLDSRMVNQQLLPQRERPQPLSASMVSPNGQVTLQNPDGSFTAKEVPNFIPDPNNPYAHNRASAISRAYDNGVTLKVLPDGSTEVTDPSGRVVEGQERVEILRKAREEQVDFARSSAQATGIGTGSSERVNATIVDGLDIAGSIPTISRGIELLQSISTGGYASVATKARQIFGVEGADEGELAANLGMGILSQLKPVFGPAFTEREGARLERISAGMGRNTETNVRLLQQLKSVMQRDAQRAIDAALSIQDYRAADEIQELMRFTLNDGGGETKEPPTVTTQAEVDALPSGAEFIEDGQRYRKP